MICAVAIEGDEDVAIAHQLNNPSIPIPVHHMCKTAEVLSLAERYLPKCHWHKAWHHAPSSCKLAASANVLKRDLEAARADTIWIIAIMTRMLAAVWTLENVPALYMLSSRESFLIVIFFDVNRYSICGQSRRRMLISLRELYIPRSAEDPKTMRDVPGQKKEWKKGKLLLQRNGYGNVKSVDHPSFTVTSGFFAGWRGARRGLHGRAHLGL